MRINLKDHDAEKYIPTMPEDSEVIGKVTRPGSGGIGALVLLDTWEFVQISDGVQIPLNQRNVYTSIIRAILNELCDEHIDLAIDAGYSLDTIKSWSSGRRVPAFGVVKLLLTNYKIIPNK